MLSSFPISLLAGAVLGFLAGLGVGGGSLLILWLTFVLGMDQPTARLINLMFFLPTALISSVFRHSQGVIPYKKILPAALCGCVAAALFTWIGNSLSLTILRKIFGVLLIITGLREIFYRPRNAK